MNNLISTVKAIILCKLPVTVARRKLKHIAVEASKQGQPEGDRQLLVDISTIIRNDDRTGIQRVVRALLLQLLSHPPIGFQVRPVFATRKRGYHYAAENIDLTRLQTSDLTGACSVTVQSGDVFLGLDLAAHILPWRTVDLARWKSLGVEINVVVYDLLPAMYPAWFNPRNSKNIRRWLRMIAIFADRLICISNTVKTDLEKWLLRKYSLAPGDIPISVIPLGADIGSSMPSKGMPNNIDQFLYALSGRPTILMVGTLEPRKCHGEVLATFERLWQENRNINLVIIGKSGWKTESLQKALRNHKQHSQRLYWIDDASDELLVLLYTKCTGVVLASYAEGFGLSLIEAMYYRKPVLARDIPVFREISGNFATYFSGEESLAQDLKTWLANIEDKQVPIGGPRHTWQNSAQVLCNCLGLKQPFAPQPHQKEISVQKTQEVVA